MIERRQAGGRLVKFILFRKWIKRMNALTIDRFMYLLMQLSCCKPPENAGHFCLRNIVGELPAFFF